MAISLLLIALLGILFLSLNVERIRFSLIKGILFFSLLVLTITELLSLFNALNLWSIVISWSVIDVILILILVRKQSFSMVAPLQKKLKRVILNLNTFEKSLIGFSVFIIVGIFIQGLIYPTNNWDAMAYHMPRIIHWIQNESLSYYRTPVYPQLNSPPFAEQLILHINLLTGRDYFSNMVQLFYLTTTIIGISLVSKELGLNKFGQLLASFIFICIPEVILLGSSTHTELVASFFMVSSIYFLIKTVKEQTLLNYLLLGCSMGLAVATKSTVYIYLSSFVLIWIAYNSYQLIINKQHKKWLYLLITGVIFLGINSGHYSRNYYSTSTIFGTNNEINSYYVNEKHSVKMMISNVSRNLSSQFSVPYLAPIAQELTEDLHQLIGANINDPKISYSIYSVEPLSPHENNGANTYHMILMLLSSIWLVLFFRKINLQVRIYWITIIASFLMFCFYLKWQPWSKLQVPFFIFYAIVLAHFLLNIFKHKRLFYIVIAGFVFNSIIILLFNYSRPFITFTPFTSEIKITDTRYKKYFSRFIWCHNDYKLVRSEIEAEGFKNIGLLFGKYDMEYQLFIDAYRSDINPIHINSCALSESITVNEKVDCIVSTTYKDSILFAGEEFYNVTKDNDGYLFLFLKK